MYFVSSNEIGKGGYATVYTARDTYGARYACKALKYPETPKQIMRVDNELRMCKVLSAYPKFVKLYDVYEMNDRIYMVQELCRGGAALDYLQYHNDKSTEYTIASIVRGTLRGLAHAHDIGIVHKDIKPANILMSDVSEDSETKICDLGLSRYLMPLESRNTTEQMEGTVFFMSPEMLNCEFSERSDIWSLGVTVYFLICGRLPFTDREDKYAPRDAVVFRSIFHDELVFREKIWATVSEEVKDFVRQCLQKKAVDRPSALKLLEHPWIYNGTCEMRFVGSALNVKYKGGEEGGMDARTIQKISI